MAEITYELISLNEEERWKKALQGIPHAFGHTWESCFAMSLTTGNPTYLFFLQDQETKVVCPFSEREYEGNIDIVTPYGFSGIAGTMECLDFYEHWLKFVRKRKYVCGYIGLNPMFEKTSFLVKDEVFEYNTLYVIDLKKNIEQLFQNLSDNRKRQVRNFEKKQHQYSTDKGLLKEFFLKQYHEFFIKKGASSVYNFSIETLSFLVDLENVVLIGAINEGKVEAVSVFAYTLFGAEYLFNVSLPEGRNHTTGLIWYAINHLKTKNISFLNLGGGVMEDDSIAKYKLRFKPNTFKLRCLKQVYDTKIYEKLCIEKGVDPINRELYFPAYRIK